MFSIATTQLLSKNYTIKRENSPVIESSPHEQVGYEEHSDRWVLRRTVLIGNSVYVLV